MEDKADGPSFEEIGHWKVPALKAFLRERGLKTTGRKAELQALAYSAVQLGIPVKQDEITEDSARSTQYAKLLKWLLCEAPCVSEPRDSSSRTDRTTATLHDRLLSDYKEGKAYSYFEGKWINEVHYYPIGPDNDACFVMTTCTPSQSIRNIPHACWVAADKKSSGSSVRTVATLLDLFQRATMWLPSSSRWSTPSWWEPPDLAHPRNASETSTVEGLPLCWRQNPSVRWSGQSPTTAKESYPPEADFNMDTEMKTETVVTNTSTSGRMCGQGHLLQLNSSSRSLLPGQEPQHVLMEVVALALPSGQMKALCSRDVGRGQDDLLLGK
ncbi:hypothetical protein Bbelb_391550 [Branchiostoma belcheri]|nr:hypothetical protein Bbelb_391550 [Branchiostoma belcheri]